MTLKLLLIGKTRDKNIRHLTDLYANRLNHYCKFETRVVPELKSRKNHSEAQQKEKEGERLLKIIQPADKVVLLDEKGTSYTSFGFSTWLQKQMVSGKKQLVFIIGGPYGFSEKVYQRANQQLALSKMTLPHELIRPFFVEQLYRGYSILNHQPYHHS